MNLRAWMSLYDSRLGLLPNLYHSNSHSIYNINNIYNRKDKMLADKLVLAAGTVS